MKNEDILIRAIIMMAADAHQRIIIDSGSDRLPGAVSRDVWISGYITDYIDRAKSNLILQKQQDEEGEDVFKGFQIGASAERI